MPPRSHYPPLSRRGTGSRTRIPQRFPPRNADRLPPGSTSRSGPPMIGFGRQYLELKRKATPLAPRANPAGTHLYHFHRRTRHFLPIREESGAPLARRGFSRGNREIRSATGRNRGAATALRNVGKHATASMTGPWGTGDARTAGPGRHPSSPGSRSVRAPSTSR